MLQHHFSIQASTYQEAHAVQTSNTFIVAQMSPSVCTKSELHDHNKFSHATVVSAGVLLCALLG